MRKVLFINMLTAVVSVTASAATQGTLGTSSTGSAVISVTKIHQSRITGINDVTFGSTASSPAKTSDDVCVYSTSGSYTVNASSANGQSTNFRMANGAGNQFITYNVEWNNAASGNSGNDLNNNATSATFNGANTSNETCSGGSNARFFIDVTASSFNSAPAGAYTDTLTLVVTPQ